MIVEYVGMVLGSGGYDSAARNNISCMVEAGVDIRVVNIGNEVKDESPEHAMCKSLSKTGEYIPDIRIVHCYPPSYGTKWATQDNIPTGIYIAWETSFMNPEWAADINQLYDFAMTPCTRNIDHLKCGGVIVPVYTCPPAVYVPEGMKPDERLDVENTDNRFIFYSIFQWIERKNPSALLEAYYTEFSSNEDVVMVLRTYRINHSIQEYKSLFNEIHMIKKELAFIHTPPITVIDRQLSEAQILGLHKLCNCFVLPHRGEGFGHPIADALYHENRVIATKYGGPEDYMIGEGVPYQMRPVRNKWYLKNYFNAHMQWADPSINELRKMMRRAFELGPKGAKHELTEQKEFLLNEYSKKVRGARFLNVIEEILSDTNTSEDIS